MSATILLEIINKRGTFALRVQAPKINLSTFTKPLDEKRFCKLRNELNILDFSNIC